MDINPELVEDVPMMAVVHKQLSARVLREAERSGVTIGPITIKDFGSPEPWAPSPFEIGEVLNDDGDVWDEAADKRWRARHRLLAEAPVLQ